MNFLFSIITPIYKTPIYKIKRLYESLLSQTYSNWEWVVYDDSPIDHKESYNYIKNLSDNRITLYTENKNIGIIGEVKKKAFSLAKGDILVEVDHDDELVDTCLENLSIAYLYSNEIGFVYGHACEIYENSDDIIDYGDNWAFGYGSYKTIEYRNKEYKVAIVGNINPKTIRHITGIPNHVRSWRKDIYNKIGGHNKNLEVADDYELIIRTFLNTKMAKINAFTYIQYFDSNNTQFEKNSEIQKLVYQTSIFYNKKIHDRFSELNINDYVWVDEYDYNLNLEKSIVESYANIIIPTNLLKTVFLDNIIQPTINNIIQVDDQDLYGYSRIYDIKSTLKYKKTEHYYNIIKWIIKLTNCQSYLELGVEYGINISEVKDLVKTCVGVDINSFDNSSDIEFYQMTTDNFFSINKRYFDIIFIDANHNFEQVRKDFDNSIRILNKFGIIILHDTDPITSELLEENHCYDSYRIVDYISSKTTLNIITFPIQETGMTFVMRKGDRRIFNIKNK